MLSIKKDTSVQIWKLISENMDTFFENSGLSHIGENILKNLPFKEKVICRLVRKSWKNILDKEALKVGLKDSLQMIQKACTIPKVSNHTKLLLKRCHEKWSKFLKEIHTKMENPLISIYIQNLFKRFGFSIGTLCDPLSTFTIIVGNVNMVKFILQNKLYMTLGAGRPFDFQKNWPPTGHVFFGAKWHREQCLLKSFCRLWRKRANIFEKKLFGY